MRPHRAIRSSPWMTACGRPLVARVSRSCQASPRSRTPEPPRQGDPPVIEQGLTYEQHEIGARYETLGRTVGDADISAFVNLCGFTEPLFMDMEYVAKESVFKGRPVPGAFTFCLSEGLIMQTGLIHGTGMSYLGSQIKIVAPVLVGDTLRVRVGITEKRETKKPDRGIVTYRHEVVNQRGELVLEAVIKRMIRRAAATP